MQLHLPFLLPRVERLGGDGRLEVVHEGGALGRLRRTIVLLERNLCTFSLFDASNIPSSKRRQAAHLHARLTSPYVAGGAFLSRAGSRFGIWWWDLQQVSTLLGANHPRHRIAIRPESLAQPPGSGWRIVKLTRGYEAQFWSERQLLASAWRPVRFDANAWAGFASLQRGRLAPDTVPHAETLPVSLSSEALALSRSEITREQAIAGLFIGSGVVASLAVAFMLGQGLRLQADTAEIVAETGTLTASTPRPTQASGLQQSRQRLAAYAELEEQTNPISATGAAVGVAALYDLVPTSVGVEEGLLTMTLPYSALEKAEELIAEFEISGYFYEVRPRTDAANQAVVIEMKVRDAAPPLSAVG